MNQSQNLGQARTEKTTAEKTTPQNTTAEKTTPQSQGRGRASYCSRCSSERRFRTDFPNIVWNLGLSAHAIVLYLRLRTITGYGESVCFAAVRTLAEATDLGKTSVTRAKAELALPRAELGGIALITIAPGVSRKSDEIRVNDIWAINNRAIAASQTANKYPVSCPTGGHESPVRVPQADTKTDDHGFVSACGTHETGSWSKCDGPLPINEKLSISEGFFAQREEITLRETDDWDTEDFGPSGSEQAFSDSEADLRASNPAHNSLVLESESEAGVVAMPPPDALAIWGRIVADALGHEQSYSAAVTARMRSEAQVLLDAAGEEAFTARCHAFVAPLADPWWRKNGYRWGIFNAQFWAIVDQTSASVPIDGHVSAGGDGVVSASIVDPDNPFPGDPDPTDHEFVNGKRVRYDRALRPMNLEMHELLEFHRRKNNARRESYAAYLKCFEPYVESSIELPIDAGMDSVIGRGLRGETGVQGNAAHTRQAVLA